MNWKYWHRPSYWKWWWGKRGRGIKVLIAIVGAWALAVGGYLAANQATAGATTVERRVTLVRTLPQGTTTRVVTEIGTVTESSKTDTQLVTVMRAGREVVVEVPGDTITKTTTVKGPVREHTVTSTRTRTQTQTQTNTQTVDRPTTLTDTQTNTVTQTETRDVPGPTQTVTHTNTVTDTETVEHTTTETTTETVTQTETVTETVTVEPPPP